MSLKEEIKGEIVLVVEGEKKQESATIDNIEIVKEVNKLIESGFSAKDAIKKVSENYSINKNEVYRIFHQ